MSINSGDTAWLLVSSALVMLMTPGLALFYGGMVRKKNALSTMMMSFVMLALAGLFWVLYGYTLAFGPDKGGIIGGLEWIGLRTVGQLPSSVYATTVPHLVFMVFQGMFAIITVALWTGGVVERIKFSSIIALAVLWMTFVYAPITHWVWGSGGWLANFGMLDFAGGAVVHITAGVSALALAMVLGPRRGFPHDPMPPHDIPMVVLGAGLLWFGWFGFNAGSALGANGLAASAFVTTNIAAATGALTWTILSWIYRRPSVLGTATGAVAGLATITPGAGFVPPLAAIPIAVVAVFIGYYMILVRTKWRLDESLDVWAVHGLGGTWGIIAVGIFASKLVNPAGANGLLSGNPMLVVKQLVGAAVTWALAFGVTWLLAKLVSAVMGLRVKAEEEEVGLDISQHGERAYGGISR